MYTRQQLDAAIEFFSVLEERRDATQGRVLGWFQSIVPAAARDTAVDIMPLVEEVWALFDDEQRNEIGRRSFLTDLVDGHMYFGRDGSIDLDGEPADIAARFLADYGLEASEACP
jgi:hypothetical protein